MKNLKVILGTSLLVLAVAGGASLTNAQRSSRALSETNRTISTNLQEAQTLADNLRKENEALLKELARVREELAATVVPANRTADSEKRIEPELPRAYQVPVYLGKTLLGNGWVVPQNPRLNTNTHHYAYDPVLVLNESFRESFVVHHTNIVEREVPTTYNNYYPPPVYYLYGGHHHGTNRPPFTNLPPQQPIPPQSPVPPTQLPQPPPKFNPGNDGIMKQELGIPDKDIKTRPSP